MYFTQMAMYYKSRDLDYKLQEKDYKKKKKKRCRTTEWLSAPCNHSGIAYRTSLDEMYFFTQMTMYYRSTDLD
jgi:hypothetical protein